MTHDLSADRSSQHYQVCAAELDRAVRHYREAAAHSERGEHVQAAHHAHIARGHFLNAQGFAHEAAKWHANQFGDEVMAEHPVTGEPAPTTDA
ncbi:MAG: hypothetical protein IE926_00045 [Micrococcales bacterium]|nr:hypothetical protein [Micrococcales bacterium]